VIVDPATGNVISKNGRGRVSSDPEGKEFPWLPKALESVENSADMLNEEACFLYIDSNLDDAKKQAVNKVAEHYTNQWKGKETPLHFFCGAVTPLAQKIKDFTNVSKDPVLMILDIPSAKKYVCEGGDCNEASLKAFVDSFVAGTLKRKEIKN